MAAKSDDSFEGIGNREIQALKAKAESLKKDTQEFLSSARNLSKLGLKDAKGLVDFAKSNWKAVLGVAAALGIGGAILKKRKKSKTKSKKRKSTKRKTK